MAHGSFTLKERAAKLIRTLLPSMTRPAPPPSPSTHAYAPTLPPEIVLHILSFGPAPSSTGELSLADTYAFLTTTARISRGWTAPSQSLLWEHIDLPSQSQARKWVRSEAQGRWKTTSVAIGPAEGKARAWNEVLVKTVLERTEELDTLCLRRVEMGPEVLALPNLCHLSTLYLRSAVVYSSSPTPTTPSFTLTSLTLHWASLPSSLLKSLLFTSLPTLRSLTFQSSHNLISFSCSTLALFPLLFPNLTSLSLSADCRPLFPLLPTATSLLRLSFGYFLTDQVIVQVLESLHAPLEVVELEDPRKLGVLGRCLEVPGLKRLKVVELGWRGRKEGMVESEVCRERGVEVQWS